MSLSRTEEKLHLRQTREMIDRDPTDLVLTRRPTVDDGQGGTLRGEPVELDPQRVKVVGVQNSRVFLTNEGQQVLIDKRLVGMPALDVAIGDRFDHGGRAYKVVNISFDPSWRTVAEATDRG